MQGKKRGKVGLFDVLKAMSERNLDVRLSPLDNVTHLRKVGAGTNVTIAFAGDVVGPIAEGKLVGGLLLADLSQFEDVRKELEAESARKTRPRK